LRRHVLDPGGPYGFAALSPKYRLNALRGRVTSDLDEVG
jgi:hypothetical protein